MNNPQFSRRDLLKHSAMGLISLPWMNRGGASWLRADETPASDTAPIRKQLIVKELAVAKKWAEDRVEAELEKACA